MAVIKVVITNDLWLDDLIVIRVDTIQTTTEMFILTKFIAPLLSAQLMHNTCNRQFGIVSCCQRQLRSLHWKNPNCIINTCSLDVSYYYMHLSEANNAHKNEVKILCIVSLSIWFIPQL